LDLSDNSRQTVKKQLENGTARIIKKYHKYFTDLLDIQTTVMVSMNFEALLIKFRLVEIPGDAETSNGF
jgi:hypothetical protein